MPVHTLLLLRHGKSDWDAGAQDDFSRPLAKRGMRNSKALGHWLAGQGLRPDRIIASPATRTLQTATLACQALALPPAQIVPDERVYEASAATLLVLLRELPSAVRVAMLVGHNPGLENLLTALLERGVPHPEDGKLMPTAALARLELEGDWHTLGPGTVRLVALQRARDLDER